MADTSDFRNGFVMELDGNLMAIVEFLHVKPGKGGAFVRTKLKNVETGRVVEKTFRSGEKVTEVRLESRRFQYLYKDGDHYYFMNNETFEQINITKERLSDALPYMKESETVTVLLRGESPIMVDLPTTVELMVVQSDPGLRGDTATNATKPAVVETGAVVNVPLFVEEGDTLKIDTRTGKYISRV
jgi:elongation factor P